MRQGSGELAVVVRRHGHVREATSLLEESVSRYRELGDKGGIALALLNLSAVAREQGDYARAVALDHERLRLFSELGNVRNSAWVLNQLGLTAYAAKSDAEARTLFSQGLALCRTGDDRMPVSDALEGMVAVAVRQGQLERAARLGGSIEALRQALPGPKLPVEQARYERLMAVARSSLDQTVFASAWAEEQAMTLEQAIAYALEERTPQSTP